MRMLLDDTFYAVCRLDPAERVPVWCQKGGFFSVSASETELSVICRQELVPDWVTYEGGFCLLRIEGTLPFSTVGVLAGISGAARDAGIPLFALSTYDTDYFLIAGRDLKAAVAAWQAMNIEIVYPQEPGAAPKREGTARRLF